MPSLILESELATCSLPSCTTCVRHLHHCLRELRLSAMWIWKQFRWFAVKWLNKGPHSLTVQLRCFLGRVAGVSNPVLKKFHNVAWVSRFIISKTRLQLRVAGRLLGMWIVERISSDGIINQDVQISKSTFRALSRRSRLMKNLGSPNPEIVKRQGAHALIAATIRFLDSNNISKKMILNSVRRCYGPRKAQCNRRYRRLARVYEDMGIVMSTWFSASNFLDRECRPIPLATKPGPRSVYSLVRAARVSIAPRLAIALMRKSSCVAINSLGNFVAQRREFVLSDFAVLRAAIMMERYLDTLYRNTAPNRKKTVLLLERNCHVPEVNLKTISPILRDIKKRGSAYIEAVNGDIEGLRRKRSKQKGSGEMSVHIFAWTRSTRAMKKKRD